MPSIPEDEQRIAELLLPLVGNIITTTGEVLVTVNPKELIQAIRQYAAKERLDENKHAQTIFNGMRVVRGDLFARCFWKLIQRGKDLEERIKQLKEGL